MENKRIIWMDVARTFAIISVLLCHSVESIYLMNMEEWSILNTFNKIFNITAHTTGRLGVPIFIFLSSALLFKKEFDSDEKIIKFYKHNLFPLFIAVECWNVIYDIFLYIFKFEEINFMTVINNLLFFEQVKMSHMWYMPMILGMYMAIPFVAYIVKRFSIKVFIVPIVFVLIASFIMPNVNIVLTMFNKPLHNIIFDLSYCGGVYGIYLLLGHYVNKGMLKNISLSSIIIGMLTFFVLTIIFQIYINNKGLNYHVWYDFLGLLITSICIFEIFHRTNLRSDILIKITRYISSISLGMFFVHRPIQLLICRYINFSNFKMSISVIMVWIITIALTVIIVSIAKRIPSISKYLFIIK